MKDSRVEISVKGGVITVYGDTRRHFSLEDNLDVEVTVPGLGRFSATLFSLDGIRGLLDTYRSSGECAGGLFLWASDMVILRDLSEASIRTCVEWLISSGELRDAFSLLE